MTPQQLFYTIIAIIVIEYLLDEILGMLNKKRWSNTIPTELADTYSSEQFENHKQYRSVNYQFGTISGVFNLLVLLIFLFLDGFPIVDGLVKDINNSEIVRSWLFFGIIGAGSSILSIPFSIYHTFVIEAQFGFNKTTVKTYIMDMVKSTLLALLLGAPIIALIVWFHQIAGALFWLYALIAITVIMVFINLFYTTLILPLFNKLTPLEEGELREALSKYALENGYSMSNIYVMDGSQRSTKANAFFSGWGRYKKIVLFDTLINDLTTKEIVAVVAHEAGHYKLNHILQGLLASILQVAVTLYLLGLVVNSPILAQAVGVKEPSFYIGLTVFGMLFTPISMVSGLLMNHISRRNEFAADRFAAETSDAQSLISALKKISANSLSNPSPHPLYVFFNYSHPTLLNRIEALRKIRKN